MKTYKMKLRGTTEEIMESAIETVKKMSPEEKAELREALRKSLVRRKTSSGEWIN